MGNIWASILQSSVQDRARVEEQIERSKSHWSSLADQGEETSDDDDEVAEESNKRVFETLQVHPTWGQFFATFGYDSGLYESVGELRVGEKFAEGGQAELFHAHITWRDPKFNKEDVETRRKWVVKVFKKGTFLSQLQRQLPRGLLQFHGKQMNNWKYPTSNRHPRFICHVEKGILLKDGRFAFLMMKQDFDLRTLIEGNMKLKNGKGCGPFSKFEAEAIMYEVALGIDWLHDQGIIHRDLKASNILLHDFKIVNPRWKCYVADYECSVGVVGTGFFRAPEILQACKKGNVNKNHDVFSRAADVYSYGMICYEVLTGKLPFEDHAITDYDVVLHGNRPIVPNYVENWTRELLYRCWESNPIFRPTIREILNLFVANSMVAKKGDEYYRKTYGYNFKMCEYVKWNNHEGII